MESTEPRGALRALIDLPRRIILSYVGTADEDSIEYWQRFTFYTITFAGILAGTICIVPAVAWLVSTRRPSGLLLLVLYVIDVSLILIPRIAIKAKTIAIALTFSLIGLYSLIVAGPEGESGIWFSVCVLILSLFVGFRAALLAATCNLGIGMTFAILHASGLIGWSVLRDFKFASWIVQVLNIFLMDLTFATANAMLIRGVGRSFASLRSAQAKVLGFLAEKETLIREIYHRSKNNMQVVTSILRIASGKLEDERSKAVLKDVINKIGSMSLVHQKLYESQDLSKIGMEAYVSELASLLLSSFGVGEGKVALDLEVEDLSMQIDAAIPCGLVINEIVTNSLKYAFPGDRRGRIAISMRETGNWVELRISDDGVGFPEGYDPEAIRKMGLGTVFTIVRHQMRGEIEFSTGRGVEYSIRFPREQYKARIGADE